jgi:hypothetical protein
VTLYRAQSVIQVLLRWCLVDCNNSFFSKLTNSEPNDTHSAREADGRWTDYCVTDKLSIPSTPAGA